MKRKKRLKIKFIERAKIKKNVLKVIYIIFVLVLLYNIIFLINTTITQKEYLELFGISLFSMDNDSMKGDINKNDLVIIKEVSEEKLEINDIIAYRVNGTIRINKIINIYNDDKSGEKCYVTKSNLNYYPDVEPIFIKQIIGEKIANISLLGFWIKILQSRLTSFFTIVILYLAFFYNKYIYQMQRKRSRKKKKKSEFNL